MLAASLGLSRILQYSLRRRSHPNAVLHDGLEGRPLRNWTHPQWWRVDVLRHSNRPEYLSVKRIKPVASLLHTHSQDGFDLRFLQQAQK